MGKIRQKNFKYHSSAPVSMDTDSISEYDKLKQSTLVDPSIQQLSSLPVQNNVFRNLVIPPSVLKQELPHASSHPKKKEKPMKIRESFPLTMDVKKMLMEQRKLDKKARWSVKKVADECKKKSEEISKALKQKKAAALGDWESLKDALTEPKKSPSKPSIPPPNNSKRKRVEQQMFEDISVFYSALQFFSWDAKDTTK